MLDDNNTGSLNHEPIKKFGSLMNNKIEYNAIRYKFIKITQSSII